MELYVFRRAASVARFFILLKEGIFMNEENTVKFLELVPGNFGDDCPANGVHYDEEGHLIDCFCDSCPFWEQCERCDDNDE